MMYFQIADLRRLDMTMGYMRHLMPGCACFWIMTSLTACDTAPSNSVRNKYESPSIRQDSAKSLASSKSTFAPADLGDATHPAMMVSANRSSAVDTPVDQRLISLGAKHDARGLKFVMGMQSLFGDQERISADTYIYLHDLSEILSLDSRRTMVIEGFSDDGIDEQENQAWSEKRSGMLRSALVSMGIDGRRISSRGYGSAYQLEAMSRATSMRQHSRLEIFISDSSGIIPSRYLLKPN